ncbi:MAG: ProQ/FinO family protein [Halothiobacillus sp.]|jgi:ProP effector|nr:ProQ/FinO family protein [Halothiobacillus sp.]
MTEQSPRPPVDDATQATVPVSDIRVIEPTAPLAETLEPEGSGDLSSTPVLQDGTDVATEAPEPQAPKKRIAPQAVVARLVIAWPQAFFNDPRAVKPLAIGTLQQILANRPEALEGLNSQAIRTGIKFYTSRLSYHYGMVNNTHRITLSGEAADEVDEKAREYAKAQIITIQQQRAAQRAAQNPPTGETGELGPDGEPIPRPARSKRPFKKRSPQTSTEIGVPVAQDAGIDQVASNPAPNTRPPRSKSERSRPRGDQAGRRPASAPGRPSVEREKSAAAEPKLSLEEKLARLAEHFGKTPS